VTTSASLDGRQGLGSFDQEKEIRLLVAQLSARFTSVPAEVIESEVRAEYERLASATVRTFIPVLVERSVTNRLRRMKAAAST